MKPRLFFDMEDRLWICKLRGTRNGYGFGPQFSGAVQAYREWRHLNRWVA